MKIVAVTTTVNFPIDPIIIDGPIEDYVYKEQEMEVEAELEYEDGTKEVYLSKSMEWALGEKADCHCSHIHGNIYIYIPKYRLDKSSIWKRITSWINVTFFQKTWINIIKDVKLKEEK